MSVINVKADARLDVGITNLIATGLCVNVGRRLDSSANPNSDMRTQSVQGASWIPAQLLELLPNQQLKVQLPPELVSRIIRAACKKPIDNAKYIVEEGLDVLRLKHDQSDPTVVSTVLLAFRCYTDEGLGSAGFHRWHGSC
jgi:hypothetical protein